MPELTPSARKNLYLKKKKACMELKEEKPLKLFSVLMEETETWAMSAEGASSAFGTIRGSILLLRSHIDLSSLAT